MLMRIATGRLIVIVGASILLAACSVRAQWVTQNLPLVPGYNPVFLQVTPANADCDAVFGSMTNIESVWLYNRYPQTSTSGASTNGVVGSNGQQDHWLMWFPKNSPKQFLRTLAQVRGGNSYYIHLATNSAPLTVLIKGIPVPPHTDWLPLDMTLAGCPIVPTGSVSFARYFGHIPELTTTAGSSSSFYSISPLRAKETQIRYPQTTSIVPGMAYWIVLNGHRPNPHPLSVSAQGEMNSVQFINGGQSPTLTLANNMDGVTAKLHLALVASEAPPVGSPEFAGSVPAAALLLNPDGTYKPQLISKGVDVTLAPGASQTITLGLATSLLAPSKNTNATYQSLIEVTEASTGYRQLVALVAPVVGSPLDLSRVSLLGTGRKRDVTTVAASNVPSSGLWVGNIKLSSVNNPGFIAGNSAPDISMNPLSSVSSPLSMRVMIHVDSNGVPRVIQQACFAQAWTGSSYVTQLYSSPTRLAAGATLTSRVSAPMWPPIGPTAMSGAFGSTLSATLTIPYDHPVNPFVHAYHPDHNNMDETYSNRVASAVESFDVTRSVTFYFGNSGDVQNFSPSTPPLQFTGTNGEYVITSPMTNTVAFGSFSVQFWANLTSYQQNGATLVLLTNKTSGAQFRLGLQGNTGTLALTVGTNAASSPGLLVTTNLVSLNSWFNVVATYDGMVGQIYINGVLASSGYLPSLDNGTFNADSSAVWLGNTATNSVKSLQGQLNDVVVRNTTMSWQVVPQIMLTPELYSSNSIVMRLQGQASNGTVADLAATSDVVRASSSGLLNLAAVPSVPLWTYGSAQGTYFEAVYGPRREPIAVGGTFQLTRVSQDPILR